MLARLQCWSACGCGTNGYGGLGMKLTGERQIAASREEVWAKLNDVDVLRRCIPGCESLEQVSPTELKATVALKIGPMNARFNGNVELKDLNPPESYRLEGSGAGGVAGRASGGADVRLAEVEGGTLLTYDVDAKVSGKIAQLGQRLINATAASLSEKFFNGFAQEFEPGEAERETEPAGAIGRPGAATPVRSTRQSSPILWYIVGGIALALIVLLIIQSFSS